MFDMIWASIKAFHANGINNLVYNFTSNWCLILLVVAVVVSVILGVTEQSHSVVHEEQNIL